MTESQWEIIKPILQEAKYRSLEEKREQINAVFLLVRMITIYSAPKKQIMIKGGLLPEQ